MMAYAQISGLVSRTNSNGGIMNFDLDGKPVTIYGLLSNQVLDGHTLVVVGKQKNSGFHAIGFYDKTTGTTHKSLSQLGWPQILIGVIFMLVGLATLGLWGPIGVLFLGLGGLYIWRKYIAPNMYMNSPGKGVQ